MRPAAASGSSSLARGASLITGGLGGLGLRAAVLLVRHGAPRVVLASRSGRVARDGQGLASQLHGLGARAEVVACDSADPSDTCALIGRCGKLVGVLHAAGAADKGFLAELVHIEVAKSQDLWRLSPNC